MKVIYIILYIPILIGSLPAYLGSWLIAIFLKIFNKDATLHYPMPHEIIQGILEEVFDDE